MKIFGREAELVTKYGIAVNMYTGSSTSLAHHVSYGSGRFSE